MTACQQHRGRTKEQTMIRIQTLLAWTAILKMTVAAAAADLKFKEFSFA